MLLALGLNACRTLDQIGPDFIWPAKEVPGGGEVLWAGWSSTLLRRDSSTLVLLGIPPCPGLEDGERTVVLPAGVKPRTFIGLDQLDAMLGNDGLVYTPVAAEDDSAALAWRAADAGPTPTRWRSLARLGTGEWLGISEDDVRTLRTAGSLEDLLLPCSAHAPPPHAPTFDAILPSSSHCLLSMDSLSAHPPHAFGSNLRSQLGKPISSSRAPLPTPLEDLAGLGVISLQCCGVHSCAVTEAGDVYAWGGRFGVLGSPLTCPPTLENSDEPATVIAAATSTTGGLIVSLEDGRVFASAVGREDLLPPLRPELQVGGNQANLGEGLEWQEMDLGSCSTGRRVAKIVAASGGRGFFFELEDV